MICDKTTYTQSEVQKVVIAMSKDGKPVKSYLCPICGGYHTTHKDKRNRNKNKFSKSVIITKIKTSEKAAKRSKPVKHSRVNNIPATYTISIILPNNNT